jgi:predicted NUDIX family NTP pyrophosphohydrolase
MANLPQLRRVCWAEQGAVSDAGHKQRLDRGTPPRLFVKAVTARAKTSAGLLPFRHGATEPEVLLVHPGGPFWKNKDAGAWSVAKGEVEPNEDLCSAAEREFREETGFVPVGPYRSLGSVRQKSGKHVHAWAFEADFDCEALVSNEVELEWPPRTGRRARFPEVDRAAWWPISVARQKINSGQLPLLEALLRSLASNME